MSNVSKRYAEALFQIGKEKSTLDHIEPQLLIVKEVFEDDQKISSFLKHPGVEVDKKKQLIDQAFDGFLPDVIHMLKLLVDRQSSDAIPSIVDHFVRLNNEAKGTAEATVYSTRPLNDEEQNELSTVFSKRLGLNSLKIVNIVDPNILGGLKIKINNTIYDGSIKGKLNRIERKIVTAN